MGMVDGREMGIEMEVGMSIIDMWILMRVYD